MTFAAFLRDAKLETPFMLGDLRQCWDAAWEAATALERERCAKACDSLPDEYEECEGIDVLNQAAEAIRSGGEGGRG